MAEQLSVFLDHQGQSQCASLTQCIDNELFEMIGVVSMQKCREVLTLDFCDVSRDFTENHPARRHPFWKARVNRSALRLDSAVPEPEPQSSATVPATKPGNRNRACCQTRLLLTTS